MPSEHSPITCCINPHRKTLSCDKPWRIKWTKSKRKTANGNPSSDTMMEAVALSMFGMFLVVRKRRPWSTSNGGNVTCSFFGAFHWVWMNLKQSIQLQLEVITKKIKLRYKHHITFKLPVICGRKHLAIEPYAWSRLVQNCSKQELVQRGIIDFVLPEMEKGSNFVATVFTSKPVNPVWSLI